jgi:hypothetical protein
MEARAHWIREVQRDCFGPEFLAVQRRKSLPRESLVARFNLFLDDEYLRIGGRLQFADLSREKNTPHSPPWVAPFHRTVDHADAHSSTSHGDSHCAFGIARRILDSASAADN